MTRTEDTVGTEGLKRRTRFGVKREGPQRARRFLQRVCGLGLLLDISLQPGEDLRPSFMAGA
jgi:hypothetical protein